ncbi:MAG: phosphoribosylglycinamide formyltransferase [Bacillota bacterium]|nr:MAG: phosphoribosylglycinamide formyltransferase [Bacillota bacterium]
MLRQIKTAVLVSGGGTNLQALIDAAAAGSLKSASLSLVISDKETAYALERAKRAGIASAVAVKKGKAQEDFEKELCALLEANGIELIVLAGFMCILSGAFTKKYENRIINVHPSLIPSFCGKGFYGLKVHEAALSYGVKVTGATVHFVNEIPDGGKIILQKAVEIEEGDTPEILQRRVMERAEWKILPAALEKVAENLLRSEQ